MKIAIEPTNISQAYDDEAYFLACHVANENLKTATE